MDFTKKTAIVTGGARGLGLSYARALAQGGARVVISDIGADNAGSGSDASVVQSAAEAFGQLDILIHNAGWVGYQNIADLDVAFLQRAMDINLYAPLWLCKHAWPHLLRSSAPRIILTTSDRAMYAQYEQTGLVAYSAGKMAQLGIMNALSHEGFDAGIRVNAISPVAKTRMWGVTEEPDELKPEWVTPGVVFLASTQCDDTDYILRASNGQFTATRFTENPGVEYPRDLARIKAEAQKKSLPPGVASNKRRHFLEKTDHG